MGQLDAGDLAVFFVFGSFKQTRGVAPPMVSVPIARNVVFRHPIYTMFILGPTSKTFLERGIRGAIEGCMPVNWATNALMQKCLGRTQVH